MQPVLSAELSEISVDYAASRVDWAMPAMHYHNAYEIYILEKGSRTYLINDALFELHAHDVALIMPNEIHSTSGGGFVRHLLCFRDAYLHRYFTEAAQTTLLKCFTHKKIHMQDGDFDRLMRLIRQLKGDYNDFVALAQILSLLAQNASADVPHISSGNQMISDVIEYIGSHCREVTSLDEIVEQFYISKSYLCRLFKEHTGISVVKYMHLLKIQSACEELQKTNQSVEEIALQCGFHTSMYFCRVFKKITGLTPSQYRGRSL